MTRRWMLFCSILLALAMFSAQAQDMMTTATMDSATTTTAGMTGTGQDMMTAGGDQTTTGAMTQPMTGTPMAMRRPIPTSTVTGKVMDSKQVTERSTGSKNLVVLLESQGRRTVVDLGPQQNLQQVPISKGSQITALGTTVNVGDRMLFLADQVQMGNQKISVNRGRPMAMRPIKGQIMEQKEVDVRTAGNQGQKHQTVLLRTADNRRVAVDLGPRDRIAALNLTTGKEITVQGTSARIGNRALVMADQITVNGRTQRIQRMMPGTQPTMTQPGVTQPTTTQPGASSTSAMPQPQPQPGMTNPATQ